MTYYMTQRPPMPGAMPKEGLLHWEMLDDDGNRVFCDKIGLEAYAKLEYSRELTEKEISDYELTPENRTVTLTTAELLRLIKTVYRAAIDLDGDDCDELYRLYKKLRNVI